MSAATPAAAMLFDPDRHEPRLEVAWSETRAGDAIERIVGDTEANFHPERHWPIHPRDVEPGDSATLHAFYPLYFGACGVFWALHHLERAGAARLARSLAPHVAGLLPLNRAWLGGEADTMAASYLMGDTGILLLSEMLSPDARVADRLEAAIAGNVDHPSRELMWGAPGTMLAARFLHRRTGESRWAELFRLGARRLWTQLLWSPAHQCHYWTQDMYGEQSTYLDAVHGFAATASVLIGGRDLLGAAEWSAWQACIENTVRRTARVDDGLANWPARLSSARSGRLLVQFCHGAPGFVVCLGDLPGSALDDLLLAAGETTWRAGPLKKGANLCHGTGGNGQAFLKLYRRTGDPLWLERARAFAMHGIAQSEADLAAFGQGRYSLWTGDPGLAVYLLNCIRATADFPTLDDFFFGS
jgi:hypothetical protein